MDRAKTKMIKKADKIKKQLFFIADLLL